METLVSSVLSASTILDRLVGGGAKKLSSVLGRFAVAMSGVIVYARAQDRKWFIDRMFTGEIMLEQNRILLTRCSSIYGVEDAIKRSMTSSSCRVCNCKTSEMRDLVGCIVVRISHFHLQA